MEAGSRERNSTHWTCARAPVRVDPAGGGTDAPPFSVEQGGCVVNMAIRRYAYATAALLPRDQGVTIYSEDLGAGVHATSVEELDPSQLEFLQGFVRRLAPEDTGLILVTESDVPAGAGLGGSGALGVAVVAALDGTLNGSRDPMAMARLANEIERRDLGYPGGNQDSLAAALGGINRLDYAVGGGTTPSAVLVSDAVRFTLEQQGLLIYTSEAHVSGNIHQDIFDAYHRSGSETFDAMVQLRAAARVMAAALEAGDWPEYWSALNSSCANLYRLHASCDCAAHRRCFEALEGLIEGGKTCGAGGGGFMMVHAKTGRRRECIRIAESLGATVWPMSIDFDGVRAWRGSEVTAEFVRRYQRAAGETAL